MAWENRKRGGKYYVRKHREGGRIVSEYVGRGEGPELIAKMDQMDRAAYRQDRADRQLEAALRTKCLATLLSTRSPSPQLPTIQQSPLARLRERGRG